MPPRPERVAAASRLLQGDLLEALTVAADAIADDLGARLGMVAWEREEQIGSAQRRLLELREQRFAHHGGEPVRVRELCDQPLEALAVAWRELRRGRSVHVESEAGASPGVYRLLRPMSELLGEGLLGVSAPGVLDHPHADWPRIGVAPRRERVALVQLDADHELAAYLLARTCLRRTGFVPGVVHRVVVVGASTRFERTLRRLWIGARMGPVNDPRAFAGPVDEARADRYLVSEAAWRERRGYTTLCAGGRLERPDDGGGCFLAPALLRGPTLDDPAQLPARVDEPQLAGPLLILHPVAGPRPEQLGEQLLEHLAGEGYGRLRFGRARPGMLPSSHPSADSRQIHGALLVERLPPGLPEPRP